MKTIIYNGSIYVVLLEPAPRDIPRISVAWPFLVLMGGSFLLLGIICHKKTFGQRLLPLRVNKGWLNLLGGEPEPLQVHLCSEELEEKGGVLSYLITVSFSVHVLTAFPQSRTHSCKADLGNPHVGTIFRKGARSTAVLATSSRFTRTCIPFLIYGPHLSAKGLGV